MDEIERSHEIGKKAFSQIRSINSSAQPRYYELWYTYASGHNGELNRQVNSLMEEHGALSSIDHEKLYDAFLSSTAFTEKAEVISSKISTQLGEALTRISEGLGETAKFSESLEGARTELNEASADTDITKIVTSLVEATKEMESRNQLLEEKLNDSREQIDELNTSLESVRIESLTDTLTSLGNRKNFDISIQKLIDAAEDGGKTFCLLVCDIDHFKSFNDTYGHQTGDQVLRLVGMVLKQNVKGQDIPCRYGGEEFAILLPGTNLKQAAKVTESIRLAVMNKELIKKTTGENLGRVTISIGVAQYAEEDQAVSMIERADAALYSAKRNGRNRVVLETELSKEQLTEAVQAG